MKQRYQNNRRRATVLLMIVGLLAMLFIMVTAYITLAQFERRTLAQSRMSEQVEEIVNSSLDVLRSSVRRSWGEDAQPDMVTGEAYTDIPGEASSGFLASPEPVRVFQPPDSTVGYYVPLMFLYPATTNLGATPTGSKSIPDLLRNYENESGESSQLVPVAFVPGRQDLADTRENTRRPFMDADGDGLPDSYFGGVAILTEAANLMADAPIRADGLDPSELDYGSADSIAHWEHYNRYARYEIAARVVSHGHMVQLAADPNTYWNRPMQRWMLRWVRRSGDRDVPLPDALMEDLAESAGSIEPYLRRRGGILQAPRLWEEGRTPPALYELQGGSKPDHSFDPFRPERPRGVDHWQRFNIANESIGELEWEYWRSAASIDYYEALRNLPPYGAGNDPRDRYATRQLLTLVNNSDDLARVIRPKSELWYAGFDWLDPTEIVDGVYPGQTKFYLGKIRYAFDAADGEFVYDSDPAEYDGYELVRELFPYFHEMLEGHAGWDGGSEETEAVTLNEQAAMLTVNTIAFAAPRDRDTGHVDVPTFSYNNRQFIGYAPQPFITEAIVVNDPRTGPNPGDEPEPRVAIAVELYNPHDSLEGSSAVETHDLDLRRFAISINNQADPPGQPVQLDGLRMLRTLENLSGHVADGELDGRSFMTIVLHDGSNTFFEEQESAGNLDAIHGKATDLLMPDLSATDTIRIKLWRYSDSVASWYMVDEIELEAPAGEETLDPDNASYMRIQRDTTHEPYLGTQNGRLARWRMVMAVPPEAGSLYKRNFTSDGDSLPDPSALGGLGRGNDYGGDPAQRSGPCVPLHMMHAGAGLIGPLHGTYRPASFPTVGFMHFVPRFTHVVEYDVLGTVLNRKPMGEILYEQWEAAEHSITMYPCDFGHMPILDNSQEADATHDLFTDSRLGRVPWGQLVYDFFTTINPLGDDNTPNTADDVDAYRISGRFNINTAPWFVLAGLPVLGPDGDIDSGDLPLVAGGVLPSPAFWSANVGVLAGEGEDGTVRYNEYIRPYGADNGQWYRLGLRLGASAASYRDRVQLAPDGERFTFAHRRDNPDRPSFYGEIRGHEDEVNPYLGATPDSIERGFLTIGELANVPGIDAFDEDNPTGSPTFVGDFYKAVGTLAMLDSHFLTTRSNTFTVYMTLYDREDPQASVRAQMTIDRSNVLPRVVVDSETGRPLFEKTNDSPERWKPIILQSDELPEIVGQREVSYFNVRYDD